MRVEVVLEGVIAARLEVGELYTYPVFILAAGPDRDHPSEQAQLGLVLGHVRQGNPHPDGHVVARLGLQAMGADALHGGLVTEDLQAREGDVGGYPREAAAV